LNPASFSGGSSIFSKQNLDRGFGYVPVDGISFSTLILSN